MIFKNAKIGVRLGLSFGVIFLVIATILLVTALSLNKVRDNSELVRDESLPNAILADNIAFETLKILELLLYASTTHNQEGFKKAEAVVDSFKLNITKFREMYKRIGDTESLKAVDELEAAFDEYYEQGKEMAFVYFTEGIEEGNELVADFDIAAEALTTRMKELQAHEIEKAERSVQSIVASTNRVKVVMFLLGGLAVALGVLVALYITRSITTSVNRILIGFKEIEAGDLSVRLEVESEDEMGQLARGFNGFSEKLQEVISQMAGNMKILGTASTELASVSAQMSSSAEEMTLQSDTVGSAAEEMSNNINSMASAAEEMSANVHTVSTTSMEMSQNVDAVSSSIEEMSTTINDVAASARDGSAIAGKAMEMSTSATDTMNILGKAAKDIGEVTELIKRIAEQTNLLALNATIEAASAGDAGKGFAVVASEIKDLATKSAHAAEDIANRIEGTQTNAEEAVKVIDGISDIISKFNESSMIITDSVEQQKTSTNEISANMLQTSTGINNIASSIAEIVNGANDMARNSAEAAKGVTEVSSNIQGVGKAASESNSSARQVNTSAGELAKMAEQIQGMIGRFKVESA